MVPVAVAQGTRDMLAPLARLLARLGVPANAVTVTGLLITVAGAVLVASANPLAGGLVLVGGTLADTLDGQLARASGGGTRFGAFLDSTFDRVADGALAAAVIWRGYASSDALLLLAGIGLFLTSSLVPYVRAKAEALGVSARGGAAPREARVVIYLLGVLLWAALSEPRAFALAVVTITILALATLVDRVVGVSRALKNEGDH